MTFSDADGNLNAQQNVDSGVSGFKYSDALDEVEGILIEVIEPKLNKQSGRLKSAREYYQFRDERLTDVTAADVLEEIQALRRELKSK